MVILTEEAHWPGPGNEMVTITSMTFLVRGTMPKLTTYVTGGKLVARAESLGLSLQMINLIVEYF